jgi:hypothetical protein
VPIKGCLVISILLCAASCTAACQSRPAYRALALGKHDFPLPADVLLGARDDQDVTKMREHAWKIFAGLTETKDSVPVWQTWYTKCDVHLNIAGCAESTSPNTSASSHLFQSLEISQQTILQLENLTKASIRLTATPQEKENASTALSAFFLDFREHPELAEVLFNQDARDQIINYGLNDQQTLDRLYWQRHSVDSPKSEREIPLFPNRAVILKTAWQLVRINEGYLTTPLFVWDPQLQAAKQKEQDFSLYDATYWRQSVQIDTRAGRKCADKDYDDIVPLDCFFAFPIDSSSVLWNSIKRVGGLTPPAPNDHRKYYLVLMAVHVITKETPDWLWATFWWYNHSSDPNYGVDRPSRVILKGGNWRHFLMNVTLSKKTPTEPPPDSGGPKICFNPYLEETAQNGLVSNCIQCHRHAAYSKKDKTAEGQQLGLSWRDAKTPPPGTLPDPHYFDDVLRTDYVWSIATARSTQLSDFLSDITSQLQLQSH